MYINVIGVIKNSSMQTVGYRLLDTDDNNKIKDVTKAQLVSVLQKKLLKVENIELVDNKTIRGKYYSLELLPKISINGVEHNLNKIEDMQLIQDVKYEMLCIVNDETIETKKIQFKVCPIPLNDFIKALYTVGERRANNPNNDKASCKITDNEIDISNYVILCDRRLSNDIKYDRKLLLVLDKLNCDTYLIIMYDEEYYYTLFRFKDIISGYNLISDKWWVTSNQFEYLADSKFLSEHCPRNSELQEVRDAIMGGVPDCYPYIGKHVGLFKSLAKQPK